LQFLVWLDDPVEFEKLFPRKGNGVADVIGTALIHDSPYREPQLLRLLCLLFFGSLLLVGSSTPLSGGDEFVEHTMKGKFERIYGHMR
jgi:hypothetical protein